MQSLLQLKYKPIRYLNIILVKCVHKSHYDVLNLSRNCTEKEIKEAYLKLSKKYHPDKNKDENAEKQFIRIVEAYNTLGKPASRAEYDMTRDVLYPRQAQQRAKPYHVQKQYTYNQQQDMSYTFHGHRRRHDRPPYVNNIRDSPYYGVEGINRPLNYAIIAVCIFITFIGTLMQIILIRGSYTARRRQGDEKSTFLAEELERIRVQAKLRNNEASTRLIMDQVVTPSGHSQVRKDAVLEDALMSEKNSLPRDSVADISAESEKHLLQSMLQVLLRKALLYYYTIFGN